MNNQLTIYVSAVFAHLLLGGSVLGAHSAAGNLVFAPHDMFFDYDINSDGVLNGMELYNILNFLERSLGYDASESRTILSMVDRNKDNQLDFWDCQDLQLLLRTEALQHRRR